MIFNYIHAHIKSHSTGVLYNHICVFNLYIQWAIYSTKDIYTPRKSNLDIIEKLPTKIISETSNILS